MENHRKIQAHGKIAICPELEGKLTIHGKIPICPEPRDRLMVKLNLTCVFRSTAKKNILPTSKCFHRFFIQLLMEKHYITIVHLENIISLRIYIYIYIFIFIIYFCKIIQPFRNLPDFTTKRHGARRLPWATAVGA
jgi:hypothetical protein